MKKLNLFIFILAVSVFVVAPMLEAHASDKAKICQYYWGTTPKCSQ